MLPHPCSVSQLKAGVEGQVAWQSPDVTLVKAVPRPGGECGTFPLSISTRLALAVLTDLARSDMIATHDDISRMTWGISYLWVCGFGLITLAHRLGARPACPSSEESDLVPGVYEGGLKVWEGCIDLVEYLASQGVGAGMPAGNTGELPTSFSGDGRQAQVLEVRDVLAPVEGGN